MDARAMARKNAASWKLLQVSNAAVTLAAQVEQTDDARVTGNQALR